jgi:hypothetical protein
MVSGCWVGRSATEISKLCAVPQGGPDTNMRCGVAGLLAIDIARRYAGASWSAKKSLFGQVLASPSSLLSIHSPA